LLPCTDRRTERSPLLPPTSCALGGSTTDGISEASASMLFAVGTASSSSFEIVRCWATFWVSTSGELPETITVSWMVPTESVALTVAVKFAGSARPSRLKVLKPVSVNVTP
jgi:hypothetical protein